MSYSYERVGIEIPEYNLSIWGTPHEAENLADKLRSGIRDICKVEPAICRGNLGVPRSQMPQIKSTFVPAFLKSLAQHGVSVQRGILPVGSLKATQKEIGAQKALGMAESYRNGTFPDITANVIVSSDNYILDGHHRWAALLILDPRNPIKVNKVDLPIRQLLDVARSFRDVGFADIGGGDLPRAASYAQ